MRKIQLILLAATVTSLAACTSVKVRYVTGNRYAQPMNGPVCLLPGGLPESVRYRGVANISASIKHNASRDRIGQVIADKARSLGADAVLNLQSQMIFRSPLPWAIVGPRGHGLAVSLEKPLSPSECESFGGITQ